MDAVDVTGCWVKVEVLQGITGEPGTIVVTYTEGLPLRFVADLLRGGADAITQEVPNT